MTFRAGKSVLSRVNVAIVGGGLTGTTLAAQLLRRAGPSYSVAVVEKTSSVGRGLAYGKQSRSLLLNVRARNMSALSDARTIFCAGRNQLMIPPPPPAVFCPARYTGVTSSRLCTKRCCPVAAKGRNGSQNERLPLLELVRERWKF
jgi:hypothetical protein